MGMRMETSISISISTSTYPYLDPHPYHGVLFHDILTSLLNTAEFEILVKTGYGT